MFGRAELSLNRTAGFICALLLLGAGGAYLLHRTLWYAGEAQELKQEAAPKSMHGESVKVYLDYWKAPALMQIDIHRKNDATRILYRDLHVTVVDERGQPIPVQVPPEFKNGELGGYRINSFGWTQQADFYLPVPRGHQVSSVRIEWAGETSDFPVYPSHHLLGYAMDRPKAHQH